MSTTHAKDTIARYKMLARDGRELIKHREVVPSFRAMEALYTKHRTQKASGIAECARINGLLGITAPSGGMMVFPSTRPIDGGCFDHQGGMNFPLFARPCPSRPRHGFVDSRMVFNWSEAVELLQEATQADKDGAAQLVLMYRATAEVSAVVTNAGVTWGRGHDGVTGGTDKRTKNIPAPAHSSETFLMGFATTALGNYRPAETVSLIKTSLYLELVSDEHEMTLVQMRDGPEQANEQDYIPRAMDVRYVLRADPGIDLLSWENAVKSKIEMHGDGLAIEARGMPLSSHFAVHGIENKIPVITTRAVNRGDALKPTKNVPVPMNKSELKALARHIKAGLRSKKLIEAGREMQPLLTAVATVHAQALWSPEPHLQALRGRMVPTLILCGLAACAGELRHWYRPHGPGGRWLNEHGYRNDDGHPDMPQPTWNSVSVEVDQRRSVYGKIFVRRWSLGEITKGMGKLRADMHSDWESGYGGRKWGDVAHSVEGLAKATQTFTDNPTLETWASVSTAANRLVHVAHNGGRAFNKWIDGGTLDCVAVAPALGFVNAFCGMVALGLNRGTWMNRGVRPSRPGPAPAEAIGEILADIASGMFDPDPATI